MLNPKSVTVWLGLLLAALPSCGGDTDSDAANRSTGGSGASSAGGASGSGAIAGAAGSAMGGSPVGGTSGGPSGGSSGGPSGGASGSGAGSGTAGLAVGGEAGQAGVGASSGAAGAGGLDLPDLCRSTTPRPPGCPCTDSDECDGVCLATGGEECSEAQSGLCANRPNGGCVCELAAPEPSLVCIELTSCPDTLPEFQQACDPLDLIGPCDYDDPNSPQRCWCMNRFGQPQWECVSEDPECPYHQPTPGSDCPGPIECFYTTTSSLAYRCSCSDSGWQCEAISG